MSIIQYIDGFASFFPYKFNHLVLEWTWIANWGSLGYTGRKCYCVCAPFDKLSCPEHRFFSRTSSAVSEPNDFNIFLALKSALMFLNHLEISGSRAVILSLHASYDSNLQRLSSFILS